MEAKKSPKTNLEDKKPIFLQIGFCISLGLMILVFGFGRGTKIVQDLSPQQEYIPVERPIEITRQEPPQPQIIAPAVARATISININIVPDDAKIEVNPIFTNGFDGDITFDPIHTSGAGIIGDAFIEDPPFWSPEHMPKFQGGDINTTFRRWMNERMVYPPMAASMGITGTVIVQFVIERDGSLTNIEVFNSSGDSSLDAEALRVIRQSPRWDAGKQGDVPVRVAFTLPIKFERQ